MIKPIAKTLPYLAAVLVLNSCQKETSSGIQENTVNQSLRATGAIPDDPTLVARTHFIISSEFYESQKSLRKGTRGKDTDGDGIPDTSDACPTQKETVNGYLDTDGCPDTVPDSSTNLTDSDGDGIIDINDACPTQMETVNGYQDTDGCPDTPPTVLEPPTTLPASSSLLMPPVGYQGGEGSCVAFAVGYGAKSADQYYRSNATSYSSSTNIFSPEFLYNQTKISDCGSGTSIIKALEFLKNTGICTWGSMPYSYSNGCSLLPTSYQSAEAANNKITTYSAVYKSDITAIKTLLINKHPLVIMVVLDQSFTNAQPGFIWKSYSGSGGFNHALTVCGYDDAKHAFKVMSSWGTGWGDAGYSWIDYDFLPQTGDLGAYVLNQ